MNAETIQRSGTRIDDAAYLIGAAIVRIELAEAWLKGNLQRRDISAAKSGRETFMPLFARPGWQPK